MNEFILYFEVINVSMNSEKSLETNISENIVRELRNLGPPFSKVFIYGFTLREEFDRGLDISINLDPNRSFLLAIQYKKPVSEWYVTYRFYINNNSTRDQHIKLFRASLIASNRIFYIFPTIITTRQLYNISPDFLAHCYFLRPVDIPLIDNHVHTVEIDTQNEIAFIFSEKIEVKPIKWKEIKQFLIKEGGIIIENLRKKLKDSTFESFKRKYEIKEEIIKKRGLSIKHGFFV